MQNYQLEGHRATNNPFTARVNHKVVAGFMFA